MKKRKRTIAPPKIRTIPAASSRNPEASQSCETHYSGQKIANLYPSSDIPERTITSILQRAGVGNIRHKGYPLIPATDALIAFYKRGFEQRDVAGESDRARKNRAEADSAESKSMDDMGATVPSNAATLYVSEFRIATRQVIEREPTLTPKQKVTVQTKLAAIRVPLPKREP